MKIIIPGGSGYLGRALAAHFSTRGDDVVVLSRRAEPVPGARVLTWDGRTLGDWAAEFDGADAVINLSGRSVNCRYTTENKRQIFASRLDSTRVVGQALAQAATPPATWLNGASATIYRHAQTRAMDEATGEIGNGFSVDVCQKWEAELFKAQVPARVRRVALRAAMVFGPHDPHAMGVYDAFAQLAKLGLGGTLGPGTQFVSWLHLQDWCRAVAWLLEHSELSGPVNVCAPHPLPNHAFMRELRRALGQRFGVAASTAMLEVGARLLGTESELLLKSRRVVPAKLLRSGFAFDYATWPEAARNIANAKTQKAPA